MKKKILILCIFSIVFSSRSFPQILEDYYISYPMDTIHFDGYEAHFVLDTGEGKGLLRGFPFLLNDSTVIKSDNFSEFENILKNDQGLICITEGVFNFFYKETSKKRYFARNYFNPKQEKSTSEFYKRIRNSKSEYEIHIYKQSRNYILLVMDTKILMKMMPLALIKFGLDKKPYTLVAVEY